MRSIALLALLLVGAAESFAAEESTNAGLLPADDMIRLEAPNGTSLLKHRLIEGIRREIIASAQWKTAQSSPQFDRLRLIGRLIEKATGEDWNSGLQQLTAGGIAASFSPGTPLGPPLPRGETGGLTLVISAKDAATMRRFVDTVRDFVKSRLPEQQREHVFVPVSKNSLEYTKVGAAAYAVIGSRLIVGSTEDRLTAALRKLQAAKSRADGPAKSTALRVTFDLRQLRKLPGLKKALQFPAKDPGQVAIFGGWMALLRRGKTITAQVDTAGESLKVRLRTDVKDANITKGLRGFFANGQSRSAAPLLELPETIYAASWYRDYQSLWDNRRSLVTAKVAKKLEEGDDTVRQQFSVIGAKAAPSRMFSLAGPHFRVAVTRQIDSGYKVKLPSKLPAAVLVAGLKDEEAFRREVVPFFKGLGLILAFEQKLLTRKSKYKDAELTTLRYSDDEVSATKGNRIRYNFATTYTITRGHLIAGTTPGIVRRAIDELDRQAKASTNPKTHVTELQHINLKNAITAVNDFEWEAVRGLVLRAGFKIDAAKGELNVLKRILHHIGEVRTHAGFDKQGFVYRIYFGGQREDKPGVRKTNQR